MSGEISWAEFWELFGSSVSAALISALLCGYLGFFVVIRRVAFVSAALGQVSGLGVALGFLLGAMVGFDPHEGTPLYLDPVVLALLFTAGVAALLAYTARVQRTPPEAVIAFVYLSATALALIVLSSPAIVQESHEVGDLLFGSAVAVRLEHLEELGGVAVLVLLSHLLLYKDLLFVSFDREMARALGLPVGRLELVLSLSIGVTVAVATRAIGALPVFGFLVLPAGAALLVARTSSRVLGLSVSGAVVGAALGYYLSYRWDWPTGPMMVATTAAAWPVAALIRLVRAR